MSRSTATAGGDRRRPGEPRQFAPPLAVPAQAAPRRIRPEITIATPRYWFGAGRSPKSITPPNTGMIGYVADTAVTIEMRPTSAPRAYDRVPDRSMEPSRTARPSAASGEARGSVLPPRARIAAATTRNSTAAEDRASHIVGSQPARCEAHARTKAATPNRAVDTAAHGRPAGMERLPARSARRSVEVRTAPAIVTVTPAVCDPARVSSSSTTASSTGTTA